MQTHKWQFTIAELSNLLFIAVMTLAKGFGLYDGMALYKISLLAGAAFFALKLCLTEQSVYEWIWTLALLGLGVLIYYNSGETGALIYIAVIVGMKGIEIKRILGLSLGIWGVTFVIQILSCLLGVKDDIFMIHEKLGLGHIIRWSLGAPHPNVLQITAMMVCALLLYFSRAEGKKLLKIVVCMFLINLYIFMYSVSYTGMITVVVYLFVHTYLCMRPKLSGIEKAVVYLAFPACATFAIFGPLCYPSRFWGICNKIFNTRFFIAMNYMQNDPITLFGGRPGENIATRLQNIDCSYVYVLMHYGVVLLILMIAGYMALVHHCVKNGKNKEIAIIIGMAVAAIAEPFFVNSSFKNITVFLLGAYLFEASGEFLAKTKSEILGRNLCFIPLGKKQISLELSGIQGWIERGSCILARYKKRLTIISLLVAIAAGAFYAVIADMPSGYYAKRSSVQMEEKEWIYLDINELPDDFDGKILNYADAETPMQYFDGNIISVEYVRGIVSVAVWCGVGCFAVLFLVAALKKNGRKEMV